MEFRFNFSRTLQSAAILLKLQPNRRMSYLRLLKLLYIADREMLAERAPRHHGGSARGNEEWPGAEPDL